MPTTLIIGQNSNLSHELSKKIANCVLLSSRELSKKIDHLSPFKNKSIKIIFNNFQTATALNTLASSTAYIENSILITAKVLDYLKGEKIIKIIYTSSSSVYGNNILCKETDRLEALSLHASLKISNEKLIEKYCTDNTIDYTITRIFNMYGGNNDKFSVISKIINSCLYNSPLILANNGNAVRDFIHIDDVVKIYSQLLFKKGLPMINIGTGDGTSIKNIIDSLRTKGINLNIENIKKNELKISTTNTDLLLNSIKIKRFKKVEDYITAILADNQTH